MSEKVNPQNSSEPARMDTLSVWEGYNDHPPDASESLMQYYKEALKRKARRKNQAKAQKNKPSRE